MNIKPIKTHHIVPNESLLAILDRYLAPSEEDIVVITSKIVSLCEGRIVSKEQFPDKMILIEQEADAYLKPNKKHGVCLTLKNNTLIASAGIDESNANQTYILYPKDVQATAKTVWEHFRSQKKIQKLGVIITDSRSMISRKGVIGFGLGYCGFNPLYSYIGQMDCFNRPLRMTQANHLDGLAAAAVHVMGEGAECTPLALISKAERIEFQDNPPSDAELRSFQIMPDDDLYAAIYQSPGWIFKRQPS